MENLRRDSQRNVEIVKTLLKKDVGVHCSERLPTNDKCIMVGTTGIAALKAEYGDDFTNFEIIQDVGYSSEESSTHLSSDDGFSADKGYFSIRVYNYAENENRKCLSLKEELEKAEQPSSIASSLESSSPTDSGFGASDPFSVSGDTMPHYLRDICDNLSKIDEQGEDSCHLQTVLDSDVSDQKEENFLFRMSDEESDDSVDHFHKKSSFTSSSQKFYKMISVDSDNEDESKEKDEEDGEENTKNTGAENIDVLLESSVRSFVELPQLAPTDPESQICTKFETLTLPITKPDAVSSNVCINISPQKTYFGNCTPPSTPIDRRCKNSLNLKRKRGYDSTEYSTPSQSCQLPPHRIRSWLKRCTNYVDPVSLSRTKHCLFPDGSGSSSGDDRVQVPRTPNFCENASSCDASGEFSSSSSADEGNALFSTYFPLEDGNSLRLDSGSADGSIETVIGANRGTESVGMTPLLLPPPLTSNHSYIRRRRCSRKSFNSDGRKSDRWNVGDIRWLAMKSSSVGDLTTRVAHMSTSEHSLKNIPVDHHSRKCPLYKQRLSSSLPNVLCHRSDASSSAEDFKGSYSTCKEAARRRQHTTSQQEESQNSVGSHSLSSSSADPEKRKKRRNRRKSSSSNRSSRSALTSCERHRSMTSGSRQRNVSSDFVDCSGINPLSESDDSMSEVYKSADSSRPTLRDELEMALGKVPRSTLLQSPAADSDVVLTHLEEQSTVSDQVWDGYQEMSYLSEAYSEATVDEDAVRKLTEFGDDYGSAIGQNRFHGQGNTVYKSTAKKSLKPLQKPLLSYVSDSDSEDLHHVISDAGKALQFARARFKRRQSGDFFSSTDNAELLATCGTYLHWLQPILEVLEIDEESNFSNEDLKELHYLVGEWKNLKRNIEMYEEVDDPVKRNYVKAQENIDELFKKMSELSAVADVCTKDFKTWEELQESISRLQLVLNTLQDTKEELLSVNLQVHRIVTEYGESHDSKDSSLKEEVTELYQRWDDVYEESGSHLTHLETTSKLWQTYNERLLPFHSKLERAEKLSVDCDKDCNKSTEEMVVDMLHDLKEVKGSAATLLSQLRGDASREALGSELKNLEQRFKQCARTLRTSRNVDPLISSSVEDDPDDHFEDAIQQVDPAKKGATKKKSSRFWRILRVALPVQLTLVLLFCLACYLEPNCCDRLNNFRFSITPHLSYLNGPPPV